MLIQQGNVYSRLVLAQDNERQWLRDYLSFDNAAARYTGTDVFCLLNAISSVFMSGFIPLIQKAGARDGMMINVLDKRVAPCTFDSTADLGWLRDYQRAALDRIVEKKVGIVSHATGGGKTDTFVGLTRALPCHWLFAVHRAGLVQQAADRFDLRALEHKTGAAPAGRIGEGAWSVGERVTCATFQTLYDGLTRKDPRVLALLKSTEGFAVDECHTIASKTFLKVACSTPNAHYRVGFSGTPLARGDRKSIYALGAIGPIVHEMRAEQLVQAGMLAKAEIRFIPCFQTHASKSYQAVYSALISKGERRNAIIVDLCKRAEKPGLVFVREVAHGHLLEKLLWRAGLRAAFVYGEHSTDWRKSLAKRLKSGDLDVIVASVVWREGEDFPFLRSVINAAGGEGVIGTLQQLGRGMRIEKNAAGDVIKSTFEAYDILDTGQHWLQRHAEARKAACLEQGFSTIVEG